jgi:toxin ParE1/3/4
MIKSVRLDSEAQEEIDAAVTWYDAESQRMQLGDELLEELNRAIRRVGVRPSSFGFASGVAARYGVRRCSLERFPYALVFVELTDEIRILAVAHHRRRPGYWRGRL